MRIMRKLLPIVLCIAARGVLAADAETHECVIVLAVDESYAHVSDEAECDVATSPASTFKLPHALIALESGVVTDPLALVPWDGTDYANESWERDHSLDSAIKSSALWFFQRTAEQIGREYMQESLSRFAYAADSYEGEQTEFWLNGDLVVTPYEQLGFLMGLMDGFLLVAPAHVEALNDAFLMPRGKVTMATGEHDFDLRVPGLGAVHAKTGNTRVDGEFVSWLVGYFDSGGKRYLFVARARSAETLPATAGADLAARVLNAQAEALALPAPGTDLNADGTADVTYELENEYMYELIDSDFDSIVDESHQYDANSVVISSRIDMDHDGVMETNIAYVDGAVVKVMTDSDLDGLFDILAVYVSSEIHYAEKYYPGRAGVPAQIGRFEYSYGYPAGSEELRAADETEEEFSERAVATGP